MLIAHYSKPKQHFQLILALYSPQQKPDRLHWVPTVLRGLNAGITSERLVVFRALGDAPGHLNILKDIGIFKFEYPEIFLDIRNFLDIQLCDIGRCPRTLEYP